MAIIEFTIHVENPDQVAALFDIIEVSRSPDEDGSPTPFSAITAQVATSAIIDGTVEGPWNLNGRTLTIILDNSPPTNIVFTEADPVNYLTVRNKINAAFPTFAPNLASEVPTDTGKIRLTSPTTGTQSVLQVSGNAAITLGLTTARANGKNASPLISANTEDYIFRDYDGTTALWYRTRYLNTGTGAASEYSDTFQAGPGLGLPGSSIVTGKIALADATGTPIVGKRMILVSTSSQIISDGSGNNYGVLPSVVRIEVYTDQNGRASVTLVKGQRLKVFIEGTTFQREFVVPTTDFDILTGASVEPDPLSIVVSPPIPIRM